MNAAQLVLAGWGLLICGAAACAIVSARRNLVGPLAFLFVVGSSVLVLPAALSVLVQNRAAETGALLALPGVQASLAFRVDQLSALFLLITAVIAPLATLYSIPYMLNYRNQGLLRYYPLFLLFFAGLIGVVCAADWLFFLVFWEFMTVCSYFLVIFTKEDRTAARAGLKYIVMTHGATALMLIAAIVTWKTAQPHSFSFEAAKATMAQLAATRPVLLHVLLALWFVGFATKAGVLPLGDWLPDAYPAAPSGAAAVFGGMMSKFGIYGLLRVFLDMVPACEFSTVWGIVIAVAGASSIFLGTLSALAQDDSKRLMSFHVIGQIGYMLLAIGAGIYLLPVNGALAALAIMAGVFHLVNNVCYKTLLFFTAGSLSFRAGETNLNRLSGMWTVMPVTGVAALIGSLSIAGVPPFNGFASKWMIYHATILGVPGMPLFLLLGILALFVSLVTLASFLKFLGGAFMGPTALREEEAEKGDVPFAMQFPQMFLAALCIAFGLVPMLALAGIHRAVGAVLPVQSVPSLSSLVGNSWAGLQLSAFGGEATGVWYPVVVLGALAVGMAFAYWVFRLGAAPRRAVDMWQCGALVDGALARYLVVEPKHEPATAQFEARFQAHGLYSCFKVAFRSVYPSVPLPHAGYPTRFMKIFDVDAWLFGPLVRLGNRLTGALSRTHSGVPQMYLIWQLVGLVAVVVLLAVWAN